MQSPESGILVITPIWGGGSIAVPIANRPDLWGRFATKAQGAELLLMVQALPGFTGASASLEDRSRQGENTYILIPDSSPYRILTVAVMTQDGISSEDWVGEILDAKDHPRVGIDQYPKPPNVQLYYKASEQGLAWKAA